MGGGGGVQAQWSGNSLDKKNSNGFITEKTILFQGSRGGPTLSRGGSTFSRGVPNAIFYRNPYKL